MKRIGRNLAWWFEVARLYAGLLSVAIGLLIMPRIDATRILEKLHHEHLAAPPTANKDWYKK